MAYYAAVFYSLVAVVLDVYVIVRRIGERFILDEIAAAQRQFQIGDNGVGLRRRDVIRAHVDRVVGVVQRAFHVRRVIAGGDHRGVVRMVGKRLFDVAEFIG